MWKRIKPLKQVFLINLILFGLNKLSPIQYWQEEIYFSFTHVSCHFICWFSVPIDIQISKQHLGLEK